MICDRNRSPTAYEGKYVDRFPCYPTAGKISFIGEETAAKCLNFLPNKAPTPEPCDRLRQWTTTPLEKHRIFHAQVNDPQLMRARSMIHGVTYPPGPSAADLINPIPQSVYQQRYNDKLESVYESKRLKPLGHCYDPVNGFPEGYDWNNTRFGIKNVYTGNAKELINPDKSSLLISEENREDHDHYLVSHRHLYPAEQAKRGYSANPKFCKIDYFGLPTPCNHEGLLTKTAMKWHTEVESEKKTPLIMKRLDDFREKYTPQIGLTLDPMKDSLNVGPNHVFGSKSKPDLYKVEDLVHGKIPFYFNTGPHRNRAVMGAIKNHLRSLHYNHYKDLKDACILLDPDNTGLLPEDQMHRLCQQFDVPVDPQLLEQLFDICHENGKTNWHKFIANFNWQERIDFEKMVPDYSFCADPCESNIAEWTCQNRLQREVEREIRSWTTSNSMYNGGGVLKGMNFPAMGIPSVRTDLPIPKIRKATDKICYGDEGGARCTLNPSIMTKHGITEMDILVPRTKIELKALYDNICPQHNDTDFDNIWKICKDKCYNGEEINLDMFKAALNHIEGLRIRAEVEKELPMLKGIF